MHPSTFSIVAIDRGTGEIGVAVASKFLAVGSAVPWAKANVGGIATQAWANLGYGPEGLRLLENGLPASEVVARLVEPDEQRHQRQLGIVDREGRSAAWTGQECFSWAGHRTGEGFTCQGNILTGGDVVEAMAEAFSSTTAALPERLVAALRAGQNRGGDSRGQQSAALLVVKEKGSYGGYLDRYIDLRVDDAPEPLEDLRRMLELHRLYFKRAEQNVTHLAGNMVREIQQILAARGFYTGALSTIYDDPTREALRRFFSVENFEERWRDDDLIDRDVLNYIRKRFGKDASRAEDRRGKEA